MRKPYSLAFKAKLLERLTGPNAISAHRLSKETSVSQQTLSRWKQEAKDSPYVARKKPKIKKTWKLDDKLRVLTEARDLVGPALGAYLRREGLHPDQLQAWRDALDQHATGTADKRRIRELERELRRKEKALAEAATILVLQKKMREILGGEADDTSEDSES
jgi:transposase-like protein